MSAKTLLIFFRLFFEKVLKICEKNRKKIFKNFCGHPRLELGQNPFPVSGGGVAPIFGGDGCRPTPGEGVDLTFGCFLVLGDLARGFDWFAFSEEFHNFREKEIKTRLFLFFQPM